MALRLFGFAADPTSHRTAIPTKKSHAFAAAAKGQAVAEGMPRQGRHGPDESLGSLNLAPLFLKNLRALFVY